MPPVRPEHVCIEQRMLKLVKDQIGFNACGMGTIPEAITTILLILFFTLLHCAAANLDHDVGENSALGVPPSTSFRFEESVEASPVEASHVKAVCVSTSSTW